MVKKRKEELGITTAREAATIEAATSETKLRATLEEIKKCDGVVGYILRNTTSASIDLKDPARIIDYAILSSTAFHAAGEASELFELGRVQNILVKGKNVKMLSLTAGENKISVFMEKSTETGRILEKLKES